MWNNFRAINLRIKIISRIYLLGSCAHKRLIIRLTSVRERARTHAYSTSLCPTILLQLLGTWKKNPNDLSFFFFLLWIFILTNRTKNGKQLNASNRKKRWNSCALLVSFRFGERNVEIHKNSYIAYVMIMIAKKKRWEKKLNRFLCESAEKKRELVSNMPNAK